jgi:Ala-tRNA(Pro) deacylase
MAVSKLIEFLDAQDVRYVTISHSGAFTAPEIAASAHIKGRELAKTVMVRVNGRLAMTVLPASHKVDLGLLKRGLDAESVALAAEQDFRGLFLDCHAGAMPPFGNLYGLDVLVAPALAEDEEIAFNACCHTKLIKMAFADFQRLVQPRILAFSKP